MDHTVHAVALPAAALKLLAGHEVQLASAVLSSEAVRNLPAGHVVVLAAQVVALVAPILKSVAAHAMHVASAQLDAEAVKYSPAGQVVFLAAHDVMVLVPALNCVDAQAVHVASVLSEPAVKYSPAAHDAVRVWHGP